MSIELHGATCVVTGSSSGIGRAIAESLGARGSHVVLSGRDQSAMEESASRIRDAGGQTTVVAGDVRDPAAIHQLVDAAVSGTGRLDVFVNNAGVSYLETVLDADPDHWRAMLDVNVFALLVGAQAAVRAMRAGGRPGHLINVSSVAALEPASGVYGATKHAVNVITNTLRDELVNDPIKITSIMPGLVATNIGRNVDPAIIEGLVAMSGVPATFSPGERLPDEVLTAAQAALGDIMIRPEDVAEAVVFAVTQPSGVHLTELAVRPNKPFALG